VIWRSLRFLAGLAVGGFFAMAAVVALGDAYSSAYSGGADVRVSGAAMSAKEAAKLVVQRRTGLVTQTCNGPCDDLSIEASARGGGAVESIRVINARGDCLACVNGQGDVPTGSREAWTIGGAPGLGVTKVRRREASRG
jgi:hypothetical protein